MVFCVKKLLLPPRPRLVSTRPFTLRAYKLPRWVQVLARMLTLLAATQYLDRMQLGRHHLQ